MTIQEDYIKPLRDVYDSLPLKTQKHLDQEKTKIWTYFIFWLVFLLLALGLIAYLVLLNPFNEHFGTWFQRSGSLISIAAVLSETVFIIQLNKLIRITHPAHLICEIYLFRRFKPLLYLSIFITVFLLIFGTLIWGYGDLLYDHLK